VPPEILTPPHALLTNLHPAEADAAEVLRRYKGQEAVERRYQAFKGPLAVAPIFLKNNRRIAALTTVICLALLIFCLVERETRRAIGPGRKTRRSPRRATRQPTGRLILEALDRLRLIPGHRDDPVPSEKFGFGYATCSYSLRRPCNTFLRRTRTAPRSATGAGRVSRSGGHCPRA